MSTCVTHHLACSCREQIVQDAFRDILDMVARSEPQALIGARVFRAMIALGAAPEKRGRECDKPRNDLISINEAAARGIERIRKPIWAHPMDHVKLAISGGIVRASRGVELYAPFNVECNGRDPISIPVSRVDFEEVAYVPYGGPLPDSEEYKAAVYKAAVAYFTRVEVVE